MKTRIQTLLICLLFVSFSLGAIAQINEIPRDTSFTIYSTYQKFKRSYPDVKPVKSEVPDGVIAQTDVVYTTLKNTPYGDRDLHLDLFRPEKDGKYPAVVLVHGGAWVTGDKANQVPIAQYLAARGYVTAAVEYQLVLEATYPAAIYNVKAAIRYLRAHAEELNIDPDKIAISGASAGGQIAALVGLTGELDKFEGDQGNEGYSTSIQAIVDMDGVIDFMAPWSLKNDRKPDSYDVRWLEGDFYTRPDRWKEASPIFWASEDMPPMLFLTSPHPRFTAGMNELTAMMDQWGIYYERHTFNVKYHAFWLVQPWHNEAMFYMKNFLDRTLKGKNP